jgi:phosphatidylserine/phosphatidylglycerophosphate/cardiolipin synthase-like enzyme
VLRRAQRLAGVFILVWLALPGSARALEIVCDPAEENCRTRLIQLIRNEQVGIDVAFWFMEDARYTFELTQKFQQGVPVRVLMDTRANAPNPLNADRLAELKAAGIPMRRRTASGILHWKMMLFDGQNTVQFSGANYSALAFAPDAPYQNYVDEAIYFTDDSPVVNSFRTKYDDLWTNTTQYADYANVTTLVRRHASFAKDPELQFGPAESFRSRSVQRYKAETTAMDVTMYRITDRAHTDAVINAITRGVAVRLITEPQQYRDPTRLWHSWNVDRLYMAGAQIRHRAHAGLMHQKSTILRSQGLTIFGSSNWTSPSSDSQEEHNYFTGKPAFHQWFSDQFDRKWNNTSGFAETQPFVPLPPDEPVNVSPAHLATNQPTTSIALAWNGGSWAHLYDIYFGTTPEPPLLAANEPLGPSTSSSDTKVFTVTGLSPGTTYYWRIVGKTMAIKSAAGPIHSFTTGGDAPPPPPSGTLGPGDILMYASRAATAGTWRVVSDTQAAGGARLANPNAGQAKLTTALASPSDYFELTFTADAGTPYRLWIRGIAESNYYGNDSVHVQFSDSVTSGGTPVWRIATTDATQISIENGNGAGLAGWGWQDNGWIGLGPTVMFAVSGTHTIRVQRREDGISIDQVLLSPQKFLSSPPGATKSDATIYPESEGGGGAPPPPLPSGSDRVIYASKGTIVGGDWRVVSDASAAGGARLENPDAGRAKVTTAAASPTSYVEVSFNAEAGQPYRLWLRLRAQNNYWANDSVHVQFSGSTNASGAAVYRIGTTASAEVNLEDCGGCGVSGWGWQDNGYGAGVLGPVVYFATTGPQTLRIQRRDDGVSIDQIVLSPATYLNSAPGTLKNDTTILQEAGG